MRWRPAPPQPSTSHSAEERPDEAAQVLLGLRHAATLLMAQLIPGPGRLAPWSAHGAVAVGCRSRGQTGHQNLGDPLVLVTCSNDYQGDESLARVAVEALRPRAAAVVTHAGMGIVGKATYAGMPIVAVPFGRDQPEIARRIVEAGTGVRLPAGRLTPERLRAAVRAAVACQPRARAVAGELGQAEPAVACADAVSAMLYRCLIDA